MSSAKLLSKEDKGNLLVLDADDTLWRLEELYDQARSHARSIVEASGLDGAIWEQMERSIDVANVTKFGMSPVRFPTSCVEAYYDLARKEGQTVDTVAASRIRSAAEEVFRMQPKPIKGVEEALETLGTVGKLALLSKGVPAIQMSRLNASGLGPYFEYVSIVDTKDPSTFTELLHIFKTSADSAWSIGNSLSSDITPALAAGMFAVWVDAHVWEYERRAVDAPTTERFFTCLTLGDAAELVVNTIRNGYSFESGDGQETGRESNSSPGSDGGIN